MAQDTGTSRPDRDGAAKVYARLWPRARQLQPLRLRRMPLLVAAVCFALGDALALLPIRPPWVSAVQFVAMLGLAGFAIFAARRGACREPPWLQLAAHGW